MLSQERRSRGLFKTENRLYSLLTRSRSRSRSEHKNMDKQRPQQPQTVLPGSKPPTRIPSRPISSTTTATNATVTPATPKQKKSLPPLPTPQPSSSRPTTPKSSSAARQKLHNLFDLALGRKSTSRSRSRSRPSSPQPQPPNDLPPLPSPVSSHHINNDATPRPRRSFDSSRSASPTPKPLRVMNPTTDSTGTTSTTHSIRMPRFFSGRQSPTPDSRSIKSARGAPPTLPPIPSLFSNQIKRVSSLHRRSRATDTDSLAPTIQRKQSSDDSVIPKITHTPATPLKNGAADPAASGTTGGGARMIYHAMKGSLDSSYRYRPAPMGGIDEEETRPSRLAKGKTKESTIPSSTTVIVPAAEQPAVSPTPVPRVGPMMSTATRATKHGSFDFERPGWSASIIQRSGSNGTTGTGGTTTSGWSRVVGENGVKERDSTYGPGLAGVGTLQRDMSVRRAQDRDEALRARERAKKHALEVAKDKDRDRDRDRTPHSSSQRTTPSDNAHGSTSTHGTGKSSSLSKATGRKALHAAKTLSGVSGVSIARHGPFAFEPAVASPTRSTGSTGTAHEASFVASCASGASTIVTEKERDRIQLEKEKMRLKEKKGLANLQKGDRPAVPVPLPLPSPGATSTTTTASSTSRHHPGFGYRSGTKGRSLDLGLGLAWAPSKVREEALLPASGFFSRSLSTGSSSVTGSRSGSGSSSNHATNGQGHERPVKTVRIDPAAGGGTDPERSKLGKEVAEMFKKALSSKDYTTFKTYVHQFDRHEIPFDGPTGIVTLVEQLLISSPNSLKPDTRKRVLDKFIRVILQQA